MKATPEQLSAMQALADDLDLFISANEGEAYPPSIADDKKTFDQLLKIERRTEREFTAYFKQLSKRVVDSINWAEYRRRVAAEEDPIISAAMKLIDDDSKLLVKLAFDFFHDATMTGAQSASNSSNIPINFATLEQTVQRQAIRYSNKFVTGINDTTRNLLRQSLRSSLDLGENVDDATARILQVIDSPVRARAIALTEPVNSYGRGILVFGQNTGAKKKVIDAVMDDRTTPICQELQEKYGKEENAIPIDEPYVWTAGGGGKKHEPGFHIRCRTGHYLLY